MLVRILGPVELCPAAEPVPVPGVRRRGLLGLLVVHRGEVVGVDRLADELWDGAAPPTARHTVAAHVHRLRTLLGPAAGRLQTRAPGYRLDVSDDDLDSGRCAALVADARRAASRGLVRQALRHVDEALGLWRGAPFAGAAPVASLASERARLEELRLSAVEHRAELRLRLDGRGASTDLQALVTTHPTRERLWRLLMLALYREGRQAEALATFRRAHRLLRDEIGIEPGQALVDLNHRILQHDPGLLTAVDGVPRRHPGALPTPRTRFVGRAREVADLSAMLSSQRLVTIVGAPGSGKTRLAVHVAAMLRAGATADVVFVSLASIDDPALVMNAVATAVGVAATDRPLADALVDHLRTRRPLLLVDNVEHVLTGAAVIGDLIDAVPGLRVLATSRGPLRLSGEQILPLGPLALEPSAGIGRAEALELFLERARAVRPGFAVTADTSHAVDAVVTHTAGLPLALELAAARLRHLSIGDLHARLDPALPLLTGAAVDAPARQRTMRDAIAWSVELLDDADRAMFRRLGVFRGGFTLGGAEAVATAPPVTEVVARIGRLVDVGLVQPPDGGAPGRFTLLAPLREYAVERLAASGELDAVARRHAEVHAGAVEAPDPRLRVARVRGWLARLDDEHDNIRVALRWLRHDDGIDVALGTAARMWRFWAVRGHAEGRRVLEDLLAEPAAGEADRARGHARIALASLCQRHGEPVAAAGHATAAITDLDPAADWWTWAEAMLKLVELRSSFVGELPQAAVDLDTLTAQARAHPGPDEDAQLLVEIGAGMVHLAEGDRGAARAAWSRAASIAADEEPSWWHAVVHRGLAAVALAGGELRRCRDHLVDGLDIDWQVGDLVSVAVALEYTGLTEAIHGDAERGLLLAAAAERLKRSVGGHLQPPSAIGGLRSARAYASERLDGALVDLAWTRGMELDTAAAVAIAAAPT